MVNREPKCVSWHIASYPEQLANIVLLSRIWCCILFCWYVTFERSQPGTGIFDVDGTLTMDT